MELSIDTSTRYASVALSRGGEMVSELSWRAEQNHSVEFIPAMRRLMQQSDVDMSQVEAIFVAKGPGGFSALRVGMSVAKAVAMAQSVPLVAVGTLDIEAQPYLGLGTPVCALIGAGKEMVYTAIYDAQESRSPVIDYKAETHQDLVSSVATQTLFCGEGVTAVAGLLRERVPTLALVVDTPAPTRRPAVLAELGHRRLQAKDFDDPATLKPIYIRGSQFEVAQGTSSAS